MKGVVGHLFSEPLSYSGLELPILAGNEDERGSGGPLEELAETQGCGSR